MKSNFLSMEYLHHGQVQGSNQLRYQGNNGRGLRQLPFLHTVLNAAPANRYFLHPSGWLAHPVIIHQAAAITNGIMRHDDALLLTRWQFWFQDPDNVKHP